MVSIAGLLTLAAIIIPKGENALRDLDASEHLTENRYLLDAGVARGLFALLSRDDPLTEGLRTNASASWEFSGYALSISISAESDKLDLNRADPNVLSALLQRVLGPAIAPRALANLLEFRNRGLLVPDTDAILSIEARFSDAAADLRDAATVYGGRLETADAESSFDGTTRIRGVERPVYTIRAQVGNAAATMARTVLIEPESKKFVWLDRPHIETRRVSPAQ